MGVLLSVGICDVLRLSMYVPVELRSFPATAQIYSTSLKEQPVY